MPFGSIRSNGRRFDGDGFDLEFVQNKENDRNAR